MKASEKAGIVVGCLFIILALLTYWMFGNKPEEKTPVTKLVPEVTETAKPTTKPTLPPSPTEGAAPITKVEPVQSSGVLSTTVFSEFPADTLEKELGEPIITNAEVMVVTNRKVTLLDYNAGTGTTDGKQLSYSLTLLSADNSRTLTAFMNASAFSGIAVGERLTVTYHIYKNANGVEFPLIVSIEKLGL